MDDADIGWSAVPNWVIRDSDLGAFELLVFIALLNRADKRGEAWPSYATLQREARASKDSVIRALRALEERGLVEVIKRRKPDGSNASNLYRVHPHDRGSLTATRVVAHSDPLVAHSDPLVAHSDQGSRSQRPEVLPIEVLPIEEDTEKEYARDAVDAAFDVAYAAWPKKVNRKTARDRFGRAARTRGLEALTRDVCRFGAAYAATTERQFTPGLDTWLLRERWTDELPAPRGQEKSLASQSAFDRLAQIEEARRSGRAGDGEGGHVRELAGAAGDER